MKKITLILLTFFVVLTAFAGCKNDPEKPEISESSDVVSLEESNTENSEGSYESEESEMSEEISEISEEASEVSPYLDGKKLVVFGDSITALGSWGRSTAENLNMYFFNGAMGGITSEQGIDRFDAYVAAKKPDYVTLLFGMNDLIMTAKNTPRVTPEQFGKNLKTLVQKVRDCGAEPILLTTNPLDPNRFYSAQGQSPDWYSEVGSPLEWLDVYNEVTRKTAEETGAFLVDMRNACEGEKYISLLSDGIHLAAKGNKIFTDTLTEWFKANYENDPDAEKVSEENTYNYVNFGESASIVSFKSTDWYTVDKSAMKFKEFGEQIRMYNTNGLWPEGHCLPEAPISVSVSEGVLNFNIINANVSSSFVLYFDGATPSAYTDGQYLVINGYMTTKRDSYTGDILPNQTMKGSVKLSELAIPSGVIHDGRVLITGIKVFVAGSAYENVTIRELSVSVE